MSRNTHRQAGELFNRLRDLPPDEADTVLEAETGGDGELRDAVLRLLKADREISDQPFLANRAIDDAARLLTENTIGLPSLGSMIGNYRLERSIGSGGMGVVYLAEDVRLNRRVALKILHREFAAAAANDVEREQRFEQEVRAAGLLTHPNIVALLDADRWQGHSYIAMEYVEGQTLRDLIAANPRGIESKTVLDWIAQVASALEAAHEAGIIHRDIKPENIMVRPDGFVKVLDFGLAKLRESSGDLSHSVSMFRSRPGSLAGTIHYLSPEQVAGRRVDRRSDLFSLGVVAYELSTGQRPFQGPTEGAIFDAILNSTPTAPTALRPEAGPEVDTLVMQALEKDVDLRFQTAADLRSTCRRLARDPQSGRMARPAAKLRSAIWIAASAAALIGAALAAAAIWASHDAEARLPRTFERLTERPGEEIHPSFSSDGKQFVYASATGDKWDIYLQRTGGSAAIQLTQGLGDSTEPALSPDGARILFRSEQDGGGLFLMESTGENPRRLTREGYFPAWAPDNRHFVYSEVNFTTPAARGVPVNQLHIADTADGSQRILISGDAAQPAWSPHGDRIAYWSLRAGGQRDIYTVAAAGNEPPVAVTSDPALDWNPVWSPSGRYLYFLSDRGGSMNVWRVRIDERTGRTRAAPEPVTVPANYVAGLSFSGGKGDTFIYSSAERQTTLHRIDVDLRQQQPVKGSPQAIASGIHAISNFDFSPDGSKLVYDTLGDSLENLWIMNADGSGRRRLTSGQYKDRVPIWSPRGDEIVFFSDRGGSYDNWMIKSDGSGLRRLTALARPDIQRSVWSPDGRRILAARNRDSPFFLDPQTASPVTDAPAAAGLAGIVDVLFNDWYGRVAAGQMGSEVVLYEPGHLVRTGVKGRSPIWPRDSAGGDDARYFIFTRGSEVFLYDRTARKETPLFSVGPNHIYLEVWQPAHGTLYFTEAVADGDLWLARF